MKNYTEIVNNTFRKYLLK